MEDPIYLPDYPGLRKLFANLWTEIERLQARTELLEREVFYLQHHLDISEFNNVKTFLLEVRSSGSTTRLMDWPAAPENIESVVLCKVTPAELSNHIHCGEEEAERSLALMDWYAGRDYRNTRKALSREDTFWFPEKALSKEEIQAGYRTADKRDLKVWERKISWKAKLRKDVENTIIE